MCLELLRWHHSPTQDAPLLGLAFFSEDSLSNLCLPLLQHSLCLILDALMLLSVMFVILEYYCNNYIRVNWSLLGIFERGLCRRVSGDTPTFPVVSFVRFREGLDCCIAHIADLLKAAKSAHAFSRHVTLDMHFLQTCGERWSCWLTGISKSVEIVVAHPRSSDFLVNRFVEFLSALPGQSLHGNTFEAIATASWSLLSSTRYAVRAPACLRFSVL